MANRARFVFLLIILCYFCPQSFADGRFYNTERIPDKIPYQRAFIIFHEGSEILILQSKYEFLKDVTISGLGWVVPVPSTPEIMSFEPDKANSFFSMAARSTSPKVIKISEILFLIFFLLCSLFSAIYFGIFVILILIYIILKLFYLPTKKWHSAMKPFLRYLILFIAAIFFLLYALPCFYRAKSSSDVDIIKTEQVGIYEAKVIKSDSENAIIEWLSENNFAYSDNDITVFKDYIEKQWCFVVARIHPTSDWPKVESRGMVAPLVLKFETDKAIYPLALTSLVGQDTEVLLYTLTENKQNCNNILSLKRSINVETAFDIEILFQRSELESETLINDLPEKMNLCKFKELLKPEQMKSDIVFESAPDNRPYIETKIIW